jgi:hypothetical protein
MSVHSLSEIFPFEIIKIIAKYISLNVIPVFALVCKSWSTIFKDKKFWKERLVKNFPQQTLADYIDKLESQYLYRILKIEFLDSGWGAYLKKMLFESGLCLHTNLGRLFY